MIETPDFTPDPSVPIHLSEKMARVFVLNIQSNVGDITKIEIDYNDVIDHAIKINSNTATVTIRSFGNLFPFVCKFVNNGVVRSAPNFDMVSGDRIFEYKKSPVSPLNVDIRVYANKTTTYRMIISGEYSGNIPNLLAAVAFG